MDKSDVTQIILNLTLETIYLLTGEDYEVMKRTSGGGVTSHVPGGLTRSHSQTTSPSFPSKKQEKNDKKVLELANQVIHILTGEVWKYLGQTTLCDYAKLEDATFLRPRDAAYGDPTNCSNENSNFHEADASVAMESTHHASHKPNLSVEAHLLDSDISTPTLIKVEPQSAEERLPRPALSKPRQRTSRVVQFLHEHGHPRKLDIYPPTDDKQYRVFVVKEEEQDDPKTSTDDTWAPSPGMSDESITLENADESLTSLENNFSASPNEERSRRANLGEELYSQYNYSAGVGGDLTKAGFSGTIERPVDQQMFLGKRLMILRKGKTFFCSECGKSSSWRSALVHHQRTHTGEKPFSCPDCGKCFNSKSHLVLHQRTHTGEKPYSCSECGKSFTCSSHLVTHRRVHTGEKPYSCSECGKSFISNSNLVRHQKFHTGDKPYSCPDCGKRYRYNSDLARHQRRRPGGKPYSCSECGACYFSKCALAVHLQSHGLAPHIL